jgi:hypothetical protein
MLLLQFRGLFGLFIMLIKKNALFWFAKSGEAARNPQATQV